MARKRMIDPEFWSDEEIGQWSHSARLFYIGLWNFADDEGRFKAHPQLLKSQIFPYDLKINVEDLKKEINSKVQWYEVEGLQYGYLRNFNKHQRIDKPQESKLPIPPPFQDHSENVLGTVPPKRREENIREVKRREEKEQVTHSLKVILSDKERKALIDAYGLTVTKKYIEDLSLYAQKKPKAFKDYGSHYAVIQSWIRKDGVKRVINIHNDNKINSNQFDPKVADLIHKTAKDISIDRQ